MAETAEKRKPNASAAPRRRSRASQPRKSVQTRVRLEQVLGLTASCSSLSSSSELVAYPAGCVAVLLNPKTNKQSHIINSSRKPFSALAFSHDGKLLVTGESGHMPCVRVWEVEGTLRAEVQSHKYGVSCVSFSSNDQVIVSVGFQHDMTVSVWDWKKGAVVASNKVSSRVCSVSFSEDSSYFVTAGNRHLRFWYLQESAQRRVNSTVPLIGRSGLLGAHKNNVFSSVACGRGVMADSTFCITSSGLLCVFNGRRTMEAWVHLKAASASSLCVSEDLVFCGCSNGVVRVFSPSLSYITTLQRPHRLGVELQHSPLSPGAAGAQFPDAVALTFDPGARLLSCVYSDHSLYSWDLHDLRSSRRLYSALYHSSCVWSLEVYPDLDESESESGLPATSFLSSSSDSTIRVWSTESLHSNRYSQDLLRIVYVGENPSVPQSDSERPDAGADGKSGLRVLAVSPDGAHLATGDRHGNLSIFGLEFLEELLKIEAHNSEVLCLEFSPLSSGVRLLASASRDRLIHIFNRDQDYSLIQSLYDHSGSITAVRFTGESPELRMVSCGADKSIYIQTAEQTEAGLSFSRSHHVVEKTSLYDMDLDSTRTNAAFACQDRNIRVYSVDSGKLTKTLKGSSSDEGALLKVTFDPSGSFVATSCSDKNICIFDYESGECVASLFGHSEIVTSIRFSQDCRHLITASGDSCIFVWRLDSSMTSLMRKRRGLDRKQEKNRKLNIRRETFITVPSNQMSLLPKGEEPEVRTPGRTETESETPLLQTNGKLPLWLRKLQGEGGAPSALVQSEAEPPQVRRRWAEQMNPIKICSSFSPSPTQNQNQDQNQDQDQDQDLEEDEEFCPQSLESLLVEDEEDEEEGEEPPGVVSSSFGLFPDHSCASDRDFDVQGRLGQEVEGQEVEGPRELSPDSACSEGSTESTEPPQDPDTESLSGASSRSSLVLEEDERNSLQNHFESLAHNLTKERFDTDPKTLQPPDEKHFLHPRLSLSTRFLTRFQDRIRSKAQASVPPRILEESTVENVKVQPQTKPVSRESTGKTGSTTEKAGSSVRTEKTASSSVKDSGSRRLSDAHNSSLPGTALQQGIVGNAVQAQASLKQNQDQGLWDCGKENLNPDLNSEGPDVNSEGPDVNSEGPDLREGPGSVPCVSVSAPSHDAPVSLAPPPKSPSPPPESLAPPPEHRTEPVAAVTEEQEEAADVTSCPAPECDRLRPSPGEQEVSLQQVQQAAERLRQTVEEAARLYRQVQSVPDLASVLHDAFKDLRSPLDSVCGESAPCVHPELCSSSESAPCVHPELCSSSESAPCVHPELCSSSESAPCVHPELCSRTVALLEKYSDLLVQMTRDKLK